MQFANRVKSTIAQQGGLVDLAWCVKSLSVAVLLMIEFKLKVLLLCVSQGWGSEEGKGEGFA